MVNSTLKKSGQFLLLVIFYSLVGWFGGFLLWSSSYLEILALPFTAGFLLLWLIFGYRSRLGFWKGIIVGGVGTIPLIFFTVIQAFMLSKGSSVEGTLFGVYNPSTVTLMWFYTAFQQWGVDIYLLPYILTPFLLMLCGISSYIGSLKK
jgi:hypothetical protein